MKTSIWKFPFAILDDFFIEMPRYAKLLHVGMQGNMAHVWALVDTDAPKVKRKFSLRGTGHDCTDVRNAEFVGTFFAIPDGSLVYHLFDRGQG